MRLQARVRCMSLVLAFAFCQIVGVMCATPDLVLADEGGVHALAEEVMTCAMDGWLMCPPLMISSPDRVVKPGWLLAIDHSNLSALVGTLGDAPDLPVFMNEGSSPPGVSPLCASFPVLRI